MRINWQKIVDMVAVIYRTFFKGKKVGGVVLPNEGQVPPMRGSKFDSKPHELKAPEVGRRTR